MARTAEGPRKRGRFAPPERAVIAAAAILDLAGAAALTVPVRKRRGARPPGTV
jgi:hypothetical protein